MTDIISKIDELIEKPCYLIDIFPCTVPKTTDKRYFIIEEYFQNNRKDWNEKFSKLLLKLYCYYNFWVLSMDKFSKNPKPNLLVELIQHCFEGDWRKRDYIDIILPDCNAMIVLNGSDLYMSIYNPDEQLRNLISQLAKAEGFFFYKAQGTRK